MIQDDIKHIVADVLKAQGLSGNDFVVERPEQKEHGDYASNAALVYAKEAGKSPKELAELIVGAIKKQKPAFIADISIAGPGFINFHITTEALAKEVTTLTHYLQNGFSFRNGEDIHIEFISANPTGALHIGHGRGAFFGDILANTLSFSGARVTREYYINDSRESTQIKELGNTALGSGDQYKTPLVASLIEDTDFSGCDASDAGFVLASKIQAQNEAFIQHTLGISFDVWFSEDAQLRATNAIAETIEKVRPFSYEQDGAVWLKTSEYGDDEDRVIVRSDGTASYFVADIAYHAYKFTRGFGEVINVWGADHQGHVKRMHAVGKMLGWPQEPKPQPIIFTTQLVSLKEEGALKKMSKRAGTAVYLEDLVSKFGIDVVRWFFAEKSLNTHMEFDMDLAREQSDKNPVYYVQYAHARIASIIEHTKGLDEGGTHMSDILSEEESARALAEQLTAFPELIEGITYEYNVHALTTYAYELAQTFSGFYHAVRVVEGDTYNVGALALAETTKDTLAQTLALLGVHTPKNM